MSQTKIQVVQFRRKRDRKTDYKKRMKLLLAGKPRIAIRKSINNIWMQVIEYHPSGDKVVLTAHSKELKKLGWKTGCGNIPAAYLTGLLFGKKAAEKKIGECIIDTGFYPSIKGSKIYAALKGAIDGGMNIPHSKEILPADDRISGKHIQKGDVSKQFGEVKQKIEGKKNG